MISPSARLARQPKFSTWYSATLSSLKAVSQLLWPVNDREVWFSLEENHEKAYRFPDFLERGTS
jgi:hypothetical protein